MEFTEFKQLFTDACKKNQLSPLPSDAVEQFYRFTLHLMEINAHTNLTAIRNVPDIITKHYIDSLFASSHLPQGATILDLGCGPGFPSIPLAIARPDLKLVALDSTEKKIRFVQESASLLGLKNLSAFSGRAEDSAMRKQLGQFDVVVSRAVARLNVLCELCMPYAKTGGRLLALKASKAEEELKEAKNAIKALGGTVHTCHEATLLLEGTSAEPRILVDIKKEKPTPPQYPRAYATILKRPL